MSVLVTGGAGYIGSALISKLLDDGYHVISVDNLSRGDYEHLRGLEENGRLELVVGDICDANRLGKIINRIEHLDAIFHLAAIPGLKLCRKHPAKAITTNIYGTYNILKVAEKYNVDKLVFASSAAVYGDPLEVPVKETHPRRPKNLYGVTKLAAEHLIAAYHWERDLPTVILRLGNVYGVGLFTYWDSVVPKFVRQALNGEPMTIFGTGEQTRDFIHVWDVVEAFKMVLEADWAAGEVFNVGTGQPISIKTVAETVAKIVEDATGVEPRVEHLPPMEGDIRTPGFCLSVEKIRERLGFRPTWNFEAGVRQLVEYFFRFEGARAQENISYVGEH
ncbi:MAG: nucleoside-diphosphate sugar epimerase [Thermoplasmata archaeon]|nr:MAG: nucleoside-diphosphate sugar epimerase [Thermoplasmata archaeon]